MNAGAGGGLGDVVVGTGWGEDRVDDMDDAVAGHHVRCGHRGAVDHHVVANGERKRVSADRLSVHAVGDCRGWNSSSDNMGEQNFRQGRFSISRVQRSKVDASIGERLVGWGKERERPVALEGGQKVGLDDGSDQRIVNARAPGRCGDVVGSLSR